jgi:hypothetical protein
LPNFAFLNRSVAYNSETEICFVNNGTTGPLFAMANLYIMSPSGCAYTIFRFYINGILGMTLGTPSISEWTNILDEEKDLQIGPGSTLQVTAVNLDPSGSNQSYEGSIESKV